MQEEKGGAPQEKVERGLEEVTGRGRAGARLLCWETGLQQNRVRHEAVGNFPSARPSPSGLVPHLRLVLLSLLPGYRFVT